MQQKDGDVYNPHSETLRQEFKYTSTMWLKTEPSTSKILVEGYLNKLTKNKITKSNFYKLTDDGCLEKYQQNTYKSTLYLTNRLIFLGVKTNMKGQQQIELDQFGKKKTFFYQEQWLDHLTRFCICRGLLNIHYEFDNQINKQTFSKVYLIKHIKSKKEYACKSFLKEDLLKTCKLKDSVLNEILIMHKINHPNILNLHQVHDDATSIYLVYPICTGGELFEMFKQRKSQYLKFSELEVAHIMRQILAAVAYLHKKEIIHRDLKLDNLMLQEQLHVQLTDFGLSAKLNQKGLFKKQYQEIKNIIRCGTPGYIAPEILNTGCYNEKVDIFSVGKPLFKGSNLQAILTENTSGKMSFDFKEFNNISSGAQQFIKRLLSLEDAHRPSALECLELDFLKLNQQIPASFQRSGEERKGSLFLANSIMPKSINLQKARKKSMRQYILLKNALNVQRNNALQQIPMQCQTNENIEEDLNDSTDDTGKNDQNDEDKLVVTNAVENMLSSCFTKHIEDLSDSSDSDDDDDCHLFVSDSEDTVKLSDKMSNLQTLIMKKKQ